jgi:RNA polymerase primary sigma factor
MLQPMIGTNSPLDRLRQRQGLNLRQPKATPRRPGLTTEQQRLLQELLNEPMDYIDSPAFHETDAEYHIYEEPPSVRRPDVTWYRPLMDDLTSVRYESTKENGTVLLTAEEERILFRQYNYARFRVSETQQDIGNSTPTDEQIQSLLRWCMTAKGYREQIAETNLALVLAMAKRTRMSEVDFADLVSEGNMALLRSVDKFDCERGFKFSTYACRAILKAFSRQGVKLSKYRQRFPTDFDPSMEKSDHLETTRRTHEEECAMEVKHIVLTNAADLSDIERTVIHHRFGLEKTEEAPSLTLDQVGQIIGVTKERVRQIQNKALEKIRTVLEDTINAPSEEEDAATVHAN